MAQPATVLYFRVFHSHFSTYFNNQTHFGLAKLSIIQFKIKLIFKMAIIRLFIIFRPSNLQILDSYQ
jgi:hypothetical protein